MRNSFVHLVVFAGLGVCAVVFAEDHEPKIMTFENDQQREMSRSEVDSLREVKSRVCNLERAIQRKGIMSYSTYDESQPYNNRVDEWGKKEKILSGIVKRLESGNSPDPQFVTSLSIEPLFAGMDSNQVLSGPTLDGKVSVGIDAKWMDVNQFLDQMIKKDAFQAAASNLFDKRKKMAEEYGLNVDGFSQSVSLRDFDRIASSVLRHLPSVPVEESVLSSIRIVSALDWQKSGLDATKGELLLKSNASDSEIKDLLASVPKYDGAEAQEEIQRFLDQAKNAVTRKVLQSALDAEKQKDPRVKREGNKTGYLSQFEFEKGLMENQRRKLRFLEETKELAGKLGGDVIITSEYGNEEKTKKVLDIVQRLADKGYRLKDQSRTILISDAYGAGSAKQSNSVSGDCRPYTFLSATAPPEAIEALFVKPGPKDALFEGVRRGS